MIWLVKLPCICVVSVVCMAPESTSLFYNCRDIYLAQQWPDLCRFRERRKTSVISLQQIGVIFSLLSLIKTCFFPFVPELLFAISHNKLRRLQSLKHWQDKKRPGPSHRIPLLQGRKFWFYNYCIIITITIIIHREQWTNGSWEGGKEGYYSESREGPRTCRTWPRWMSLFVALVWSVGSPPHVSARTH